MEQKLDQLARLDFEFYIMPVRRARGPSSQGLTCHIFDLVAWGASVDQGQPRREDLERWDSGEERREKRPRYGGQVGRVNNRDRQGRIYLRAQGL